MTKLIKIVFAVLLTGYCAGSFISWSFNPGQWEGEFRALLAFMCSFVGIFIWVGEQDSD